VTVAGEVMVSAPARTFLCDRISRVCELVDRNFLKPSASLGPG